MGYVVRGAKCVGNGDGDAGLKSSATVPVVGDVLVLSTLSTTSDPHYALQTRYKKSPCHPVLPTHYIS